MIVHLADKLSLKPFSIRLLFLLFVFPVFLTAQPFGFISWNTADGLPQSQVFALAEDEHGFIWAGTQGGGVARFDGREFEVYTTADGLPDNFVNRLWTDDEGQLFATSNLGVAVFLPGPNRFEVVSTKVPAAPNVAADFPELPTPVARLEISGSRSLVASRTQGLYLVDADGEILRHYTENNSDLPHNSVRALLKDRQGRYWLGTSGGGLVRMIPTGIRHFDRKDGLLGERVYALHQGKDRLWLGAGNRGIQFFDSTGFRQPPIADPSKGTKITSIAADVAGRFTFVATRDRGVVVLDDSLRVERLTRRSGLPADWVMKLLVDEDSDKPEVWVATFTEGLAHVVFRDSSFAVTNYNLPEGQQPLRLTAALHDSGTFFLGTRDGEVHRWQWREGQAEIQPETFGAAHGLPSARISALALRRGTQLWVGVSGYGLYYTDLRMSKLKFFPLPSRLQTSTNIFQLTAPPDRPEVWIGTEKGVDRLLLNRDGQPDYLRSYGKAEGFIGGETTGASLVDDDGTIWFGTMNGLARYEATASESVLAPPPTFLESVDLFYTPLDSVDYQTEDGQPVFNPSSNHLNFRYRAVDLTYPDRVRYRYRMSGFAGKEWSPLSDETTVRFAGLEPGRYNFTVMATTDGGKSFGPPAEFAFRIKGPLLQQAWFLGVIALLGSLLLIAGFYGFYRRIQQREAVMRQQLEAKNQLLELEQKALRLQMNPHFIFNALNGIRGLVGGGKDDEARRQISRFAALMRGILNNSRQDQITLAEEIQVLDDYLKMEQFCQPFCFTYSIEQPENADSEEISLPPMLLQPYVENAVLHGLSGLDADGHISVRFVLRGRRMQCFVVDNGIGRRAAAERRQARVPGHKSVAMDVTRSRIEAMKGRLKISDRTGGGTEVEIWLPVETW